MRRSPSVIVSCALLVCVVFAASSAQADDQGLVRLQWVRAVGAETCPSARSVESEVEMRVGRQVFADDGDISVEATVARASGTHPAEPAWNAQVFVRSATGAQIGRRDLSTSDGDCAALTHAVALAIAVALHAEGALREAASQQPSSASPPPSAAPVVASSGPPPTPSAAPSSSPPDGFVSEPAHRSVAPLANVRQVHGASSSVGLVVAGALWLLPSPAIGTGVVFEARPRHAVLSVRATAMFWPEQRADDGMGHQVGVQLEELGLDLAATFVRVRDFRLEGVLGTVGGVLTSAGYGFQQNIVQTRPLVMLESGLVAHQGFGPFFGEVGVAGVVPLVRYPFTGDIAGVSVTLWTSQPVVIQSFLALGLRF